MKTAAGDKEDDDGHSSGSVKRQKIHSKRKAAQRLSSSSSSSSDEQDKTAEKKNDNGMRASNDETELAAVRSLASISTLYAVTRRKRDEDEEEIEPKRQKHLRQGRGQKADGRCQQLRRRAHRHRHQATAETATAEVRIVVPLKVAKEARFKTSRLKMLTSIDNPLYFLVPHPCSIGGRGGSNNDVPRNPKTAVEATEMAQDGGVRPCRAIITPNYFSTRHARSALRAYSPAKFICNKADWNKAVTLFFDSLRRVDGKAFVSKEWIDARRTRLWHSVLDDLLLSSSNTSCTSSDEDKRKPGKEDQRKKNGPKKLDLVTEKQAAADRARKHLIKLVKEAAAETEAAATQERGTLAHGKLMRLSNRRLMTKRKVAAVATERWTSQRAKRMSGRNVVQTANVTNPISLQSAFLVDVPAEVDDCYRLLCGTRRPSSLFDNEMSRVFEMVHESAPHCSSSCGDSRHLRCRCHLEAERRRERHIAIVATDSESTPDDTLRAATTLACARLVKAYRHPASSSSSFDSTTATTTYYYSPKKCALPAFENLAHFWRARSEHVGTQLEELGKIMLLPPDSYVVVHDSSRTPNAFVQEMKLWGFRKFVDLCDGNCGSFTSTAYRDGASKKVDEKARVNKKEAEKQDKEKEGSEKQGHSDKHTRVTGTPSERLSRAIRRVQECVYDDQVDGDDKIGGSGWQVVVGAKEAVLLVDFSAWTLRQLDTLARTFSARSLSRRNVGAWIIWNPNVGCSPSFSSSSLAEGSTSPSSPMPPEYWNAETNAETVRAWFVKKAMEMSIDGQVE